MPHSDSKVVKEMEILVFGSLNIDRTYLVDHLVCAGETLSAKEMEIFCGGKGFNQAIALARAGSKVHFAGAIGEDGDMLLQALSGEGIDISYINRVPVATGHAIIQVDSRGHNSIIVLPGANGTITTAYIDRVLSNYTAGDLLVLQNEVSNTAYLLNRAKRLGMIVAFNPSPFDERVLECDMDLVDYLLINETEGKLITERSTAEEILEELHRRYAGINVVLTLGRRGVSYISSNGVRYRFGIYRTESVDTTAAGDTFTGYFLSELFLHHDLVRALQNATVASGIAVSRMGSSASIPRIEEVRSADMSLLDLSGYEDS